jgi:ClpA/ClpB-like protein
MARVRSPVELSDLIRDVEDTASSDELERLDAAFEYSDRLKTMADDLVGHFVTQARTAGASWAQIGERLGVTKQAAHQRHFGRMTLGLAHGSRKQRRQPFERFAPEAKEVIVVAQQEARDLRHNYLGVEHLLLALSADPAAGPLMSAAGAPRDAILEQIRREVGEGTEPAGGSIPFTPRSKRSLELAAREAGRGRIRSTHILLGALAMREGVGAAVLDELGVSRADLRRGAEALASRG